MHDLALSRTASGCSFLIVILLVACGSVSAATLLLNDGSVIHGDIKTLQDGVYSIETDSLGVVRVRKQNVRSIDHSEGSALGSPVPSSSSGKVPGQAELQAMQTRMMQQPDLVSMIQGLKSDPAVQAVLSDPEIMSAVASGDFASLMNHPKIIALTNNGEVREVIEAVR